MYSLGVRREFRARHYLIGGDWGDENYEHTHCYRMELVLEAAVLDDNGFLVDIVEVEHHLDEVTAVFRDRTLNMLAEFSNVNPSIERLATVIHEAFRKRFAHLSLDAITVSIWEDDIAWTSYRASL